MNPFLHTSASQMDTFADAEAAPFVGGEGCNRAWWFNKILGLPKPTSASAARGSAIHKTIEKHLLTGAALPPDLETHAKPFMPLRAAIESKKVRVEYPIEMMVGSTGIALKGFVDLWSKGAIDDWKTSGDTRWFKTKEEIAKDTQMLLYGYAQTVAYFQDGKGEIRLAHNQLLVPRGAATVTWSQRTEVTVPVSATLAFWKDRAIPLTERMKEVSKIEDASAVTPNWNACGRFGGCPYQSQCAALKGAGAVSPVRNPFSHPTPKEPDMPPTPTPIRPVIRPVVTNPAVPAATGKPLAPAAVSGAVQSTTPTQPVRVVPPVARAQGIVPPDAPTNAKPGMPTAPAQPVAPVVATPPAPAAEPTEKEKSDTLLTRKFVPQDITDMDEACFARIYEAGVSRDEIDFEWAEDDQGSYIAGFTVKAPPVVETPAAPGPRRRGAAVTSSQDVVVAPIVMQGQMIVTKIAQPGVRVGAPAPGEMRQPRNADARLHRLMYTKDQIDRMSTDTKAALLGKNPEDGIHADRVSVLADGTALVFETSAACLAARSAPVVEEDPEEAEQRAREEQAERDGQAAGIPPKYIGGVGEFEQALDQANEDLDEETEPGEGVIYDGSGGPTQADLLDEYRSAAQRNLARIAELEGLLRLLEGQVTSMEAATLHSISFPDMPIGGRITFEKQQGKGVSVMAIVPEAAGSVDNRGFTLLIDCTPMKGCAEVTLFDDFIAPHHTVVAQANGADHIDACPGAKGDGLYGRGPGMIAARLLLPGNRPAAGTTLVVSSDHPLAAASIAALAPFAARVVRGRR